MKNSKYYILLLMWALFFIFFLNYHEIAFATEKLNIELLGKYNASGAGYKESFDISSDTVYFAAGRRLKIIDFSDSNSPNLLGNLYANGSIGGIAKEGHYVYASDSSGFFKVFDISDPTNPIEAGSLNIGNGAGWDIVVNGNFAYQDGSGVLRIINVSNPAAPTQESTIAVNVISLDVSNNHAFVGTENSLEIIDVSNPTNPNKIYHLALTSYCWDLVVKDNFLYLIDGNSAIRIIDVSNPANPIELKSYEMSGSLRGIDYYNNYLYVGGDSLRVLNISDLDNIYLTGYYFASVNDLIIGNYNCYTIPGVKKFEYLPPSFSDMNAVTTGQTLNFNKNDQGDGHEVEMVFSYATGNGNIAIDQFNRIYPDIPNSNPFNCFWDINLSSKVTSFSSDVSFHYSDDDILGYDESSAFLGMAKFNRSQLTWEWLGGELDTENNKIKVDSLDSYSSFVLFRRIFGDVTGDGFVDLADFQRMGDVWGQTSSAEFAEDSDARFFNYHKSEGRTQKIDENDLQIFDDCWHNGVVPGTIGQNSTVGIQIDFNYLISGNQNQSSISPPGSNIDVYFEVNVSQAPNLDTYEFELNYAGSDMTFEGAFEDNSFSGENNFLKKNGGSTVGFQVSDYGTHITIRNTLVGDHGWDTPDGDGLLALIKFRTKVDSPGELTFGSFDWYNNDQVHYVGTDKGKGSLPVELSSFNASVSKNKVILKWQTKTETNNYGFSIEKSNQYDSWMQIGFVNGAGTSIEERNYSFIDRDVSIGNNFYRLKQIDFNGQINYSKLASVFFQSPTIFKIFQNYPNPFNPITYIDYQIPSDCHVIIMIFNTRGQAIRTIENENKSAGYYTAEWDGYDDKGNSVVSGIYFYKIHAGKFQKTKKMVIIK